MSVEAVLTVVTVILAVLALIPRERAHDLKVRIGTVPRLLVLLVSSVVLYWSLLEEIHSLPLIRLLPRPFGWPGDWTPASASLVVLLATMGIGYWSYRRTLPVFRLSELSQAVSDALARRRYSACLHLIDTHLSTIRKAHRGEYWTIKLRKRFLPTPAELFLKALDEASRSTSSRRDTAQEVDPGTGDDEAAVDMLKAPIRIEPFPEPGPLAAKFRGWAEQPKESAQDLVRVISLAPALIREIAGAHPYLGAAILRIESTWLYREFAEEFSRALMRDPDSVLYRELRHAENIDSNGFIAVDPREQPLIAELCKDATRPDGPKLLYTFLDAGIDSIRSKRNAELLRLLNGPLADFHERGRWFAPPFVTVYLLEIVAPRIAVDPKAPLVNLYVANTLVSSVLHQLEPDVSVDTWREWPTPFHYVLYKAVSVLRDLVLIAKDPGLLAAVQAERGPSLEARTLPDHAIDVLGAVMYQCMSSEKLDVRFKSYLLEVWWRAYSDKNLGDWENTERVLEAFARGGSHMTSGLDHRDAVGDALSRIDPLLQISASADALRARFGL